MSVVRRAVVITVSDRVTAGAREDVSGRVGADLLEDAGWQATRVTVSDDRAAIADSIESAVTGGADLVVTTGGTGVGPRDVTPEATEPLLRMQLPGIAEQIRDVGVQKLPQAMLSRGVAGICRQALVVNLAGSPGAVRDGIPVVLQVADHVIAQLSGGDHA
ncbi:MAG TPA: MogA/MoaB family molybdenum cofactor biosynthesis protein [Aeromicrobium sp.]|nr:MogA/MoaB family molybdenum cofactor biosynthesis protein [Aeromicrobium sp.]